MSDPHDLPTPRQLRLALVLVALITAIIAAVVVHSLDALLPLDVHPFLSGLIVGLVATAATSATAYGHARKVKRLKAEPESRSKVARSA